MAIQDHYLPEDLTRLNEELLNLHNLSITVIKNAQEGNFDNMTNHKYQIVRSIKLITALHNKKKMRDQHIMTNNAIYNRRGWISK